MKLQNSTLKKIQAPAFAQTASSREISKKEQGFTLIELMISLVLGLLVSAAALQIFYTSSVNSRRQEASSQIQDNAIFGFSQMQQHLRRANYGAKSTAAHDGFFMNHLTPQGGVVLTSPSGTNPTKKWLEGNLSGLVLSGSAIPSTLLTSSASTNSVSNLNGITNSDQLTIQYQAGQEESFDCEGSAIPTGFYVIERYFVRMDTSVTPSAPGLACASAIYDYDETTAGSTSGLDIATYTVPGEVTAKANNLAGTGTIIVPNVDYFRAMLGVSTSTGFATDPDTARIAYIPIPSTSTLATQLNDKRIVSLQMGVLSRSNNPTSTPQANSDLSFSVLDKSNIKLNTVETAGPTYLRNVYESTVLLRNARGGI